MNEGATTTRWPGFEVRDLGGGCLFEVGRLPDELRLDAGAFDALWRLHPDTYHEILMRGRLVLTPRWQQAYERDYHYTGRTNAALPLPGLLRPLFHAVPQAIDARLNGALLNWYDGALGHYIGRHRDSRVGLVVGAPIVTVSLGAERVFRLRPWRGTGHMDFPAADGAVFVMPYATNLAWTHEVPHSARSRGRRISITFRAFA